LTQKRNKKSKDGSKRNFPVIGNILGRTVARSSRCCTDLNARFFMRDLTGVTTALISQSPAEYKNGEECRLQNRRLQNFTLFNSQKYTMPLPFEILSSCCTKAALPVLSANYIERGNVLLFWTATILVIVTKKSSFISSIG